LAANGPCETNENIERVSEGVCTDGHDSKICLLSTFSLDIADSDNLLSIQTEMMSDAIDDALDNDEAEEETEELTNQVCFSLIVRCLLESLSFQSTVPDVFMHDCQLLYSPYHHF